MGTEAQSGWGRRLRALREAKGISRRELATRLKVDVTSISGWESDRHIPRAAVRMALGKILGVEISSISRDDGPASSTAAALVDATEELPDLLVELTKRTRRIRTLRLASPYPTPTRQMTEWRNQVRDLIENGTIQIETVEIFYDLRRLKEVLSNIFHYDRSHYVVRGYSLGVAEMVPALGAYIFDDHEFLLYGYWKKHLADEASAVRASGPVFKSFLSRYWEEASAGGMLLNPQGARNLTPLRRVALQLGLPAGAWETFIEEARNLDIGDGCPPIV